MTEPILTPDAWRFLAETRRATLATIDDAGRPRLVPICFVARPRIRRPGRPTLHTPLDEKPKRTTDPLDLARVRDIMARPAVTILVDRWFEDWSAVGLVARQRGGGPAPSPGIRRWSDEREAAIVALRAKYPQYADHDLASRPLIRITLTSVATWGAREPLTAASGRSAAQEARRTHRPEAVRRDSRLVVAAGVEDRDDVALLDRPERVVLGEDVAALVDVAGHRHPPGPGRIGRPADDDLLGELVDEVRRG